MYTQEYIYHQILNSYSIKTNVHCIKCIYHMIIEFLNKELIEI